MAWPTRKLGELADICRGSSPRPICDNRYFDGGTIPWIKIADATKSGKFLYETKEHVNDYGASFSRKLPPGTILVAASGTLGYTQILGVEGCAHDGWLILQGLRNLDRDFAYYALKTVERHFYNSGSGAAIQNINTDILRQTQIPYPPIQIQRRIAEILSAYDDLIENNRKRIAILDEMARRLYREWFVHFRYPGHESVPLVDSPLGRIPQGWETRTIGSLCDRVTDGAHVSPKSVEVGLPMASSKDMHAYGLDLSTARHIAAADFEKLERQGCRPLKHDILVTKDGANYCKNVFVYMKNEQIVLLSSVAILRPQRATSPFYLAEALKSEGIKSRLKLRVSGAAIPRIILADFKQFEIPYPSLALIKEWDAQIAPNTALCVNLVDQNEVLRRTRDLLLPRLMSGRLSVTAAEAAVP